MNKEIYIPLAYSKLNPKFSVSISRGNMKILIFASKSNQRLLAGVENLGISGIKNLLREKQFHV